MTGGRGIASGGGWPATSSSPPLPPGSAAFLGRCAGRCTGRPGSVGQADKAAASAGLHCRSDPRAKAWNMADRSAPCLPYDLSARGTAVVQALLPSQPGVRHPPRLRARPMPPGCPWPCLFAPRQGRGPYSTPSSLLLPAAPQSPEEREYSAIVQTALEAAANLDSFPKATVDVYCLVRAACTAWRCAQAADARSLRCSAACREGTPRLAPPVPSPCAGAGGGRQRAGGGHHCGGAGAS